MPFEFQLPDVGEGIHEGEIVNWLVDEGDTVEADEDIVEVMTDKATVQISAPVAGTIREIVFAEGDVVEVGEVFVTIEPAEGEADVDQDEAATEPEPASPSEGARGASAEPDVGEPSQQPPAVQPTNGQAPRRTPEDILAPPSVRIEARKQGIDLSHVQGSGPAGRIRMEDLASAQTRQRGEPTQQPAAETAVGAATDLEHVLPYDIEPGAVDRSRASKIEPVQAKASSPRAHAARAKRLQPHFTHAVEIDADELVANVQTAGERDGDEDELTTAFVVKAVAGALREHERCNAWVDEDSRDLVVADAVNVAVATPTAEGLELRTVANADELGVRAIAERLADGGDPGVEATFTVTSYDGLGGLVATPVLVHPQVACLSMGRIREVAVLEDGEVRAGKRVSLAFTFDHRYVDGYDGALMAEDVAELLAQPGSMLLGGS